MKECSAPDRDILWHAMGEPLPDFGTTLSGYARTPMGMMHLTWTSGFLLDARFAEPSPVREISHDAQKLANHIVSRTPLPLRPVAIGTPFQLLVWQALTRIPYGTTTTYSGIAHAIGSPKASRAVGSAVGANRLALLIPCHRVIRRDGHIGGFAWGIPTKHKILAHEQS